MGEGSPEEAETGRKKPPPSLPATVTAIRPQKRKADRFSLYHESTFLIGLSGETLANLGLRRGMELTESMYGRIVAAEEYVALKSYMLRLLGRRGHSSRELTTKARAKGYGEEACRAVIVELQQKRYLDNDAFARQFISDKLSINRWGPVRIRAELAAKGIDAGTADRLLQDAVRDLDLREICVDLVLGRRRHFSRESDPFRRRQKMAAWLQRRGFGYTTIEEALPELTRRLNVS